MALDPSLAILFVLTTAVGWLMIVAGIGKRTLGWRHGPRVCPSCGRERIRRTCGCGS